MHLKYEKDLEEICPVTIVPVCKLYHYHSHTPVPVPGPLAPGCLCRFVIKTNLVSSFLYTNDDVSSIFNRKALSAN